ncbi:uncharacterized protein LOC142595292 [Pelecanus crispus]|uniref:uncharacterized protein LOC142595292 n=1 Tax=Pelecanus crispus TaxID=36300 RepID=UPI003F5D3A7B
MKGSNVSQLTDLEEDLLVALRMLCVIQRQVAFGFPNPNPAYPDSLADVLPRPKDSERKTAETIGTTWLPGAATARDHRSELREREEREARGTSLKRGAFGIKAGPSPHSLTRSSRLHLLGNKVHLQPQDMSCYNPCLPCPPCGPCGPTPLANSCNEPCVRQCQDSTVVIEPSPVVVTLPGPILSSFPQSTAVGSSTSAAVGSILSSAGVPINSGGSGLSGFGLSGIGSCYRGRPCLPC